MVTSTSGLIAKYCQEVGAATIVKGLRQNGDYEAEIAMAVVNRNLSGVETLFMPSTPGFIHISSTIVKDVARHGGDICGMVPDNVVPYMMRAVSKERESHES